MLSDLLIVCMEFLDVPGLLKVSATLCSFIVKNIIDEHIKSRKDINTSYRDHPKSHASKVHSLHHPKQ
jgi:hypothetical protein